MEVAASKFDIHRELDRELFQHIVYVSNRSFKIIKQEGISRESISQIGKLLWRLLRVVQAYNHKNRDVTLEEIINLVNEFKEIFGE